MQYYIVFLAMTVLSRGLGYPQAVQSSTSKAAEDDSDTYLEPQESRLEEAEERGPSQQTFYPSFSPYQPPPLGHSRPFYYQEEGAYSQRPHGSYHPQQLSYDSPRYSGYKDSGYRAAASTETRGLLGSGNFGVIRGGTFYDKDAGAESSNYDRDFNSFFRNGHGRPQYFGGVPNPRPYQHEQFENFRDFADINAPTNPAYSQYVVVYVNKNATKKQEESDTQKRPKNIIESLALLDLENALPEKKLSKSKAKLAKLLPEKKHKHKNRKAPRELSEPLLALS